MIPLPHQAQASGSTMCLKAKGEIVCYIVTQSSTTMSYGGQTSANNSVCAWQDCSSRRRWHHDQTNTVTSSPRLRSSFAQFASLAAWVPISPFLRFPSFELRTSVRGVVWCMKRCDVKCFSRTIWDWLIIPTNAGVVLVLIRGVRLPPSFNPLTAVEKSLLVSPSMTPTSSPKGAMSSISATRFVRDR